MNITKRLVLAVATVAVASCGVIAVQTAPAKMASVTRGESAKNADVLFWEALHSGDYNGLPQAIRALTAAYLQDPNDSVTAAHLGWAHIWRLAESSRLDEVPPTITDHAVLARRYFQEAVALDPSDARYLGFLGSTQLAEGNIHRDEKLTRTGYFTLLASIEAWPEFNLFTAGYMMSRLPADSPRFKQGLEWQWQNLDVCVGEKVDRLEPRRRSIRMPSWRRPLETGNTHPSCSRASTVHRTMLRYLALRPRDAVSQAKGSCSTRTSHAWLVTSVDGSQSTMRGERSATVGTSAETGTSAVGEIPVEAMSAQLATGR